MAAPRRIAEVLADARLPRLEQRMLLGFATGLSHSAMVRAPETELEPSLAGKLEALVQRRLSGEPMAYILGEREFYGRSFKVDARVLIPRPETELLVDLACTAIRADSDQGPWRVLDLGTGSGCVAISVALECPGTHMCAIDVAASALEVAIANALALGAMVTFTQADVRQSGLELQLDGPFDMILANLPYIHGGAHHLQQGDLRFEPKRALTDGKDGLTLIDAAIQLACKSLSDGGLMMLEHGHDQGLVVRQCLRGNGFKGTTSHVDLAGIERVTVGWHHLQAD